MIETIWHNGKEYPRFQSEGFAAQFAIPFAQKVCHGTGFDIGCNRSEWSLPGAILIDPIINGEYNAMRLPPIKVDFVFSSHAAEHLSNWVEAVDYWITKIKSGGTLFLYLPDMSAQSYWRPWNNRKHIHYLTPEILNQYLSDHPELHKVFVSGTDMNCSFIAMAEKI